MDQWTKWTNCGVTGCVDVACLGKLEEAQVAQPHPREGAEVRGVELERLAAVLDGGAQVAKEVVRRGSFIPPDGEGTAPFTSKRVLFSRRLLSRVPGTL